MQYQTTPQGLSSMFDSNVANGGGSIAATPSMMALLGQQQDADAITQQDQQRQLNYDTANDPLRLQQSSLANQTTQAQLPGVAANAAMLARTNSNQAATNDENLKQILSGLNAKDAANHVDELGSIGNLFAQHGAIAQTQPLGAKDRLTSALMQAGHPELVNPEWNSMSPADFAADVSSQGTNLMNTSSKLNSLMQVQNLKNAGASDVERQKAEAARYASDQRLQAAQDMVAGREKIAGIPKNLADYAAKMAMFAQQETDPSRQAAYADQAGWATEQLQKQAAAAAGVNNATKPNLNSLGINTVGPNAQPSPSTTTPPMAGAQPSSVAPPQVGNQPPPAAIQMLRGNPGLAAQFDAKYGPGSAAKLLGQ